MFNLARAHFTKVTNLGTLEFGLSLDLKTNSKLTVGIQQNLHDIFAKFEYLPNWSYGRSRCCALALVSLTSSINEIEVR